MKAPVTGVIEKVLPIRHIDGKRFLQEFTVVEAAGKAGAKEKPFLIQNWGDTREELEQMAMEERKGETVTCDCYWNGYQYTSQKYGTQYGIRVSLINIKSEV